MIKIKTFDEDTESSLDKSVNNWLDNHFEINIKDIKFSTYQSLTDSCSVYGFCAMVIYDNGHKLTAEELIDRSNL